MEAEAALREQAQGCAAMGSPMYADLLDRLADDLAIGGPTATVLASHEDDPGPDALGLRLLGSVHRLVLERRASEVGVFYPSVGGSWRADEGSAAVLSLLAREPDLVREWLDRPPQTNEVGRAAALVGALLHLPEELRLPVRLVELGASGGLNLLADRFWCRGEQIEQGDPGSSVRLGDAWRGRRLTPWPGLRFVEAVGCDPRPLDVLSTPGRLALTAYVWPDQLERLARLRGALDLAARHPPVVRRSSARDLLAGLELRPGTTTVVWHSVMWQYLEVEEQRDLEVRLEQLSAAASAASPLLRVAMEPRRREPGGPHEFLVTMQQGPEEPRVLGVAAPHGVPVTWETDAGAAPNSS